MLFTFPSWYWSTIGHRRVFSLGGWSPLLRTGFHVPGPTRDPDSRGAPFRVRGCYPVPRPLPGDFRYGVPLSPARAWEAARKSGPTTPHAATPSRLHVRGFGLLRFRSPLLAQSRLISLPPGTEMFQFPGLPPRALWIQARARGHGPARVPPFGHLRLIAGICPSPQLIAANRVLRRLPMPRHPPCALNIFSHIAFFAIDSNHLYVYYAMQLSRCPRGRGALGTGRCLRRGADESARTSP